MAVTFGTGLGIASKAGVAALMVAPIVNNALPERSIDPADPAPATAPEIPVQLIDEQIVDSDAPSVKITLVRVDEDGSAVIGGSSVPKAYVSVVFQGISLSASQATGTGDFVLLADLPPTENAQELYVAVTDEDGQELERSSPVLVLGRQAEEAPRVVLVEDSNITLVDSDAGLRAAPSAPPELTLDAVTYDKAGDVAVSGQAGFASSVRVYLDNDPVTTQPVDSAGNWQLDLPNVDTGVYTLRIDELNAEGAVTNRLESPFQKVEGALKPGTVIVQPGNTLWSLAQSEFGFGDRYVVIFDANKDLIKDPNLIYPGQIFTVPDN
ncbi:MAG: LysM peptidoglycan-binding domain-containing protein [Pseudomonadota bacterium]